MTDLFRRAMRHASTLPPEMQDEVARMVMAYAGNDASLYRLTPEEHAAIDEADAAMARGDFATEEEMQATFAKFRL